MIGLIGLGTVGVPIAHKLYLHNRGNFALIARGVFREELERKRIDINGDLFLPRIISSRAELPSPLRLLIVCVKNYQLQQAIEDIKFVVDEKTIILPLENGITAYRLLKKEFPNNVILEGYAQGPNTELTNNGFEYKNAGSLHIGSSQKEMKEQASYCYEQLKAVKLDVIFESEIRRMVWRKWMLNIAGNTVTALLNISYAQFSKHRELKVICRKLMQEVLLVAQAQKIDLTKKDIEEILQYFNSYQGEKYTSMLEDIRNQRITENEYITGEFLRLAAKHNIATPMNELMYNLIKAKESLYL